MLFHMNRRALGIASTLVGASLWGFSGTCSQYLLSNYAISSLFITMVRTLGSAALFLPIIAIRYPNAFREIRADANALRRFALFGIGGLYGSQVTYVIAIGYTNAGTATVLQSTSIVLIMLATCLIARRLPHAAELVGLMLAVGATVLIATQGDLSGLHLPTMGLAWGLLSAIAAAGYSMLPKPLYPRWGSFTVVGVGMAIGGCAAALVWALAFAFPGIDVIASGGNAMGSALVPTLDAMGIATLVIIVVVGTFGAFFLFLNGISMVGPVQGSQLGAIEPVSATVCSAVLVGTAFSIPDWIGLVLMVCTIILVAAGGSSNE